MGRNLENLLEFAKRNGVLDDPSVRRMVLAAGASDSEYLQRLASQAVLGKSVGRWSFPFDSQRFAGRIRLGNAFSGRPFLVSEVDLSKHLLAVGQSGSGKTTLFYNLYSQVGRPVWFFDLKQDYRHLLQGEDLLVLSWSEFKFKPLSLQKVFHHVDGAQVFSEIFGHATALLSGSKNYLLKKLIELYQSYGLVDPIVAQAEAFYGGAAA